MPDQLPDGQLTASTAAVALAGLCRDLGLDDRDAVRLGPVGDNAVFKLPVHGVVARLALARHNAERFGREVAVARWLAEQEFPAARVLNEFDDIVVRDGVVASFWDEVPEPTQGSPAEIGEVLRHLHALPPPSGLLDWHDPFAGQRSHIEAAELPESDGEFLLQRLVELEQHYTRLRFTWPVGVVHGDAHRKNVVRAADGRVVLLDLERFGLGHREWDLVVPAVYQRVGWYSHTEYHAFVEAYGFDITDWADYPTVAAIRELRMTTWLAARTGREPRLIPEVQRRIASLRDGSASRNWVPGE